jgi:antitoxin VapB
MALLMTRARRATMETAMLFEDESGQTVRLPAGYHLPGGRVRIRRLGDALILAPEDGPYGPLLDSLAHFSDAFMADPADPAQGGHEGSHP